MDVRSTGEHGDGNSTRRSVFFFLRLRGLCCDYLPHGMLYHSDQRSGSRPVQHLHVPPHQYCEDTAFSKSHGDDDQDCLIKHGGLGRYNPWDNKIKLANPPFHLLARLLPGKRTITHSFPRGLSSLQSFWTFSASPMPDTEVLGNVSAREHSGLTKTAQPTFRQCCTFAALGNH